MIYTAKTCCRLLGAAAVLGLGVMVSQSALAQGMSMPDGAFNPDPGLDGCGIGLTLCGNLCGQQFRHAAVLREPFDQVRDLPK